MLKILHCLWEPYVVSGVCGILLIYLERNAECRKRLMAVVALLCFMMSWRIVVNIKSSRYAFGCVIPVTVLSGYALSCRFISRRGWRIGLCVLFSLLLVGGSYLKLSRVAKNSKAKEFSGFSEEIRRLACGSVTPFIHNCYSYGMVLGRNSGGIASDIVPFEQLSSAEVVRYWFLERHPAHDLFFLVIAKRYAENICRLIAEYCPEISFVPLKGNVTSRHLDVYYWYNRSPGIGVPVEEKSITPEEKCLNLSRGEEWHIRQWDKKNTKCELTDDVFAYWAEGSAMAMDREIVLNAGAECELSFQMKGNPQTSVVVSVVNKSKQFNQQMTFHPLSEQSFRSYRFNWQQPASSVNLNVRVNDGDCFIRKIRLSAQ